MSRLARLLITWLLLAAVPLQGWAMAARACHAAGGAMPRAAAHGPASTAKGHGLSHDHAGHDGAVAADHAAATSAHAHPAPAHALHDHGTPPAHGDAAAPHDPPDRQDTPPHAAAGCSHCAACCVGALLPTPNQAPRLGPPAVQPAPQPDQPAWPFLTGGPERPPRAI